MMSFRRKRLGEILSARGAVSQEQITEQLGKPESKGKRIGEALVAAGLITEEMLAQALAEQRDLRYLDLTEFRISPKFFETMPVDLMHRYQFVPVEDSGGSPAERRSSERARERPEPSSNPARAEAAAEETNSALSDKRRRRTGAADASFRSDISKIACHRRY